MRKFLFLLAMFAVVFSRSKILAQSVSGETELGTDGRGETFASQYAFLDGNRWNILVRYFGVHDAFRRVEFAAGPSFKFKSGLAKLQFGYTTGDGIMTAGLLIVNIKGHDVIYIVDGKLSTRGDPYELYQKLFVSVAKVGKGAEFLLRGENLRLGNSSSFLRIGVEGQVKLNSRNSHLFVAPFYCLDRRHLSGQVGLRIF